LIKVWIIILTTAMPPHVKSMTQDIPVLDEVTCRAMEVPAFTAENGLYWSARCKSILVPKPKEEKK
jgi:hypothetical protein